MKTLVIYDSLGCPEEGSGENPEDDRKRVEAYLKEVHQKIATQVSALNSPNLDLLVISSENLWCVAVSSGRYPINFLNEELRNQGRKEYCPSQNAAISFGGCISEKNLIEAARRVSGKSEPLEYLTKQRMVGDSQVVYYLQRRD